MYYRERERERMREHISHEMAEFGCAIFQFREVHIDDIRVIDLCYRFING